MLLISILFQSNFFGPFGPKKAILRVGIRFKFSLFPSIFGVGEGFKNCFLGSTYVVEQLSFSMFHSILTFDFELILGSFLNFWGPDGLFLGLR